MISFIHKLVWLYVRTVYMCLRVEKKKTKPKAFALALTVVYIFQAFKHLQPIPW